MRLAKLVTACGLTVVLCAACGIKAKPLAGTPNIDRAPGNHAKFEDPRNKHVSCLRHRFRKHHYHVTEYLAGPQHLFAFHVGTTPGGPTVVFEDTPGAAEADQLQGGAIGAEVLGAALIYPNRAFDREMIRVEVCVGLGVIG
jgi:hypothetical protein